MLTDILRRTILWETFLLIFKWWMSINLNLKRGLKLKKDDIVEFTRRQLYFDLVVKISHPLIVIDVYGDVCWIVGIKHKPKHLAGKKWNMIISTKCLRKIGVKKRYVKMKTGSLQGFEPVFISIFLFKDFYKFQNISAKLFLC